jgi:hypothetical protein
MLTTTVLLLLLLASPAAAQGRFIGVDDDPALGDPKALRRRR